MEKEKKNKKPVDKMKIVGKIIASIMIVMMLFSVGGTLMYYIIQK